MSAITSQITSVSIVCSNVCSGVDQRKRQNSASLAFVRGIHRWPVFPSQRGSNAENVSIWCRHHDPMERWWLPNLTKLASGSLGGCNFRIPTRANKKCTENVIFWGNFTSAQLDDIPIISMGDLNYDYKLDESLSNNPIHYIEMAYEMTQLILQPTRVTSDTSTTLDLILVSHLSLHKSSGVMKYNFSDHYLVYTEFEFNLINQKGSTHNVMKFRDMKRFNPEKFLNDLNSCEILNGSLYDEDISWENGSLSSMRYVTKMLPLKKPDWKSGRTPGLPQTWLN